MGKPESLDKLVARVADGIRKRWGPKADVDRADRHPLATAPALWVPSGSLALDVITGGGYPVTRVAEVYGDPSSGKSLLLASFFRGVQAMGGVCVLGAAESFDAAFADAIGVNRALLDFAPVLTVEAAEKVVLVAIDVAPKRGDGALIGIGLDSLAALPTEHELEELDAGDQGARAKRIRRFLRVATAAAAQRNVAVVITNQTYERIGVMFGEKKSTSGGKALPFFASLRVELEATQKLLASGRRTGGRPAQRVDGRRVVEEVRGVEVRAYVSKSKVCPPFREAEVHVDFKTGLDPWTGFPEAAELYLGAERNGKGWLWRGGEFASSRELCEWAAANREAWWSGGTDGGK